MNRSGEHHEKAILVPGNNDYGSRSRSRMRVGGLIHIRYKDHVLFKDSDSALYLPWTRETVGWLDYEDKECIRLVWERFSEPNPPDNARPRSTGLTIMKKAIVEMHMVG